MTARQFSPRFGALARRVCALAAAAWLAQAPALAREQDLGDVVSRLPDSVEFVAALDNAATLRTGLGDSPLMLALSSVGRPARVIDAWTELSNDLGMTGAEAFDLLLGRRVVFLASGLKAGDAQTRWALLSELDPVTERRLRVDLGAVPRRLIAGQPVLELEHGNFLMATSSGRLRCAGEGRFEPSLDSTILLLAPSEDRELFEAMLPLLHCQAAGRPLADLPGGAAVRTLPTGDAVFLWRMPDPLLAPDRFIAASASVEAGVWRMHAIAGPPRGWVPNTDPEQIAPWSPDTLATLPDKPALAVMGLRSMVQEARAMVLPLVSPFIPEPDPAELDDLLGDRSIVAVWLHAAEAGEAASGAEVLCATESREIEALAERAQHLLRDMHADARPNSEAMTIQQDSSPAGALSGVRTVRITRTNSGARGEPGAPEINWAFVPEQGHQGRGPGWWVVHLGPTGAASTPPQGLNPAPSRNSLESPVPPRRYLHAGFARPMELLGTADAGGGGQPGVGQMPGASAFSLLMSRIDLLEWAVWASEDARTLEAELTIRPPPTAMHK